MSAQIIRMLTGSTGVVATMAAIGFVLGFALTYFAEDKFRRLLESHPIMISLVAGLASAGLLGFSAARLGLGFSFGGGGF